MRLQTIKKNFRITKAKATLRFNILYIMLFMVCGRTSVMRHIAIVDWTPGTSIHEKVRLMKAYVTKHNTFPVYKFQFYFI